MVDTTTNPVTLVKIGSDRGHTIVNKNSQLRRLNYFDGKFLRAPDLILEQLALLNQIRLSNQAGGAGVVHGYNCTAGQGDSLQIGSGFALDFSGRALLLGDDITVSIPELIEKARSDLSTLTASNRSVGSASFSAKKADFASVNSRIGRADFDDCVIHNQSARLDASDNNDLYLITINHAEAYCGEEDVFGKLCSEACASSTSHSYIIEGIEVRAVPLNLSVLLKQSSAVALSQNHLRSRVAAAFFAQERGRITSHISASGLNSLAWCLGAEAASGSGIPIALLGRNGTTTLFLDAWAVRRERMESPPRQYWAGRMAMRPWNVFLAQVLQFQCQLRGCLTSSDGDAPCKTFKEFDPCADTREVAREAAAGMRYLLDSMGKTAQRLAELDGATLIQRSPGDFDGGITRLEQSYQQLVDSSRILVPNRLLINCGIVEVPSAGYLPVNASSTISVNEQVERLVGEGLDLRFCVVRPDFVPHALEEAQHMERICLLTGLDDPALKPQVDVLVPNGKIQTLQAETEGSGYQSRVAVQSEVFEIGWPRKFQVAAAGVEVQDGIANTGININRAALDRQSFRVASADLPTLTGAARGEQLDSGGFGFYLAAQSAKKSAVSAATLASARQTNQSLLHLLDSQNAAVLNTNTGASTAETASTARLASGFRINTNAATAGLSSFTVSTLVPDSSMWLDLKIERDPFSLNVGEATDIRANISMVISQTIGGQQRLIIQQRNISGQLHIQKSAPQKTDTKLTARLIAQGIWSENIIAGAAADNRTEAVKLDETVIISRASLTGLPPTISVVIVNPSFFSNLDNVQMVLERFWVSPTESQVRCLLRYQIPLKSSRIDRFVNTGNVSAASDSRFAAVDFGVQNNAEEILLAEVSLREDQAVLKPGNAFHSASISALNQIGKATSDTSFSDQAGNLLFPPAKPIPSELRILAHESWVLFHRRRDKVCAFEAAEEEVIKPRRYRVYHVHLQAQISIDELATALETNSSGVIAKFEATPVDVIDYAPGLASVTTAHTDVRADWQAAVQVDADIHIGLIASEGDVINDGEALADNRLQSLTDLLAPVSEVADDLVLLSVNEIPPTLAAGEVDGVVIYFTKAVSTICHSVYRLVTNSTETILGRLEVYLNQSSGESLPSFVQNLGAQVLSTDPRFIGGSDTFFGAEEAGKLAASWDLVNNGPVTSVVAMALAETPEEELITRRQSSRISRTVGTEISADSVIYRAATTNIFKPCPKATLLLAEIECNDVYIYTPPARDVSELVKALTDFITTQGITADVLNSSQDSASFITQLSQVNFYRDSSQFEATSRSQFLLKWQSELSGQAPASFKGLYIAVARTGASTQETADNLAHARSQAEKLQGLMGIDSSGVVAVTNNAEVDFPVACRAFTLTVIPRDFGFDFTHLSHVVVAANTATTGTDTTDTTDTTDSTAAQPALSANLANSVRFDANNEVIRDADFNLALKRAVESETRVKSLELVSVEDATDEAAEARARSLLKVLKEEGAANNNAKLVVRKADATESAEIIRSGFLLNRGMVLK